MAETTSLLGPGSRVKHPAYGDGVIVRLHKAAYEVCFILYGLKMVGKDYDKWQVVEAIPAEEPVTFTEAERSLMRILQTWSDITEVVPLGDRWTGGTMILKPGDETLKSKEIPIETFFHKIVMVRDRLRVMEQRINSSPLLSDEDKVNLQQYITRIYGSLTTFNVLFKYKEHNFVGEKGKE
ncbi:MAG: hypothetical protein KatS3mg030_447 [Saprospiraceae bacterium]|nr:MAG: hypothetical protein KatS3mg030_447 [Saprospiraceae bacterium]